MEIYLMRHAVAVDPNQWPEAEKLRPLSSSGKAKLLETIPKMNQKGFAPSDILSSPFARAKETAKAMAELVSNKNFIEKNELASGVRAKQIQPVLAAQKNPDKVLIIGHMPDLALYAAHLIHEPSLVEAHMKPGEIWAIDPGSLDSWGKGKMLWQRDLDSW